MDNPQAQKGFRLASIALISILFLVFFQLIADFVEAIYAFGLLGTSIPAEIVAVLFLFSPLLLLFLPRGIPNWLLLVAGELALLSRILEVMLDTRGRMLVSGLGVSAALILLPGLLWVRSRSRRSGAASIFGASLAFAVVLSILLRALGSGTDITNVGMFKLVSWALAVLAGVLLPFELARSAPAERPATSASRASFGGVAALSLGLVAALTLLYFAFTALNVIARWTGASYLLVIGLGALGLAGFAWLVLGRSWRWADFAPGRFVLLNVLFVASLVLAVLPHQVAFPGDPGGYPLYEPPVSWLVYIPLVLTLLLFPLVVLDFALYARALLARQPSPRALGGGFALGALFLLLMIFSHVFTTVYDYIPFIGSFFRDKFWLVYAVVGVALLLPLPLIRKERESSGENTIGNLALAGALALLALASFFAAWLTSARPSPPPSGANTLRVMTYNVQQGYSEAGQKNFDGQLALIRLQNPDLLGLQESDTNRIAGGNSDLVRYFADRLGMYSYYGPKTVPGTFGIALLSRYPIENPRTFYMYSEGEQTATIWAQVTVDGHLFNVFVTHLGNGGPIVQQQAILGEVQGVQDVILMGDFNFRPDTEQYRITLELLEDAWLVRWPSGVDDQGLDPDRRIDHVFLTPGTQVLDARYLLSPASDHPAEVVQIGW